MGCQLLIWLPGLVGPWARGPGQSVGCQLQIWLPGLVGPWARGCSVGGQFQIWLPGWLVGPWAQRPKIFFSGDAGFVL